MELKAVRGMHDLWGDEVGRWQTLEQILRSTLESFGYVEIRTPVVEKIEVFTQTVGDDTDIVEKQMYEVKSASEEERFVLRPEGTAAFMRAVLEHQLHRLPGAQRFYYLLPMFRYERPQKGRLRQFHQFGAELIGDASAEADAEIIFVFDVLLKKLSIRDYALEINSVGCGDCRPIYREALIQYFKPHLAELCEQCQGRLERAPMRILDCKNPKCAALVAGAPTIAAYLCEPCRNHHRDLKLRLTQLEVAHIDNPRIVRGLDYYSRTAFEFTSTLLGAQSALGGGGRYDGLAQRFGEDAIPAVGWALGMERFMIALEQVAPLGTGKKVPFVFFAPLDGPAFEFMYPLAMKLQRAGVPAAISYERDKKLKWLMKQADRVAARYTLLIGEDERQSGRAILKNMSLGTQEEIEITQLEKTIAERAKSEA